MFRGSFLLRRLAPPDDEGDVTGNDCGVRGGATLVAGDVVVGVGSEFSLIGTVFARGSVG